MDLDLVTEYSDADTDGGLLLIGSEDDGRVYLSVNDRSPVLLSAEQAERAGHHLLARAAAGRRS